MVKPVTVAAPLSLPVSAWPAADRSLLSQALPAGGLFDDESPAASWSAPTCERNCWAYGRWLAFLADRYLQSLQLSPAERVTPDRVAEFVTYLAPQVSARTVYGYIAGFTVMIRALCPASDWQWLRKPLTRLQRLAPSGTVGDHQLVPVQKVMAAGLRAMDEVDQMENIKAIVRAVKYRDGLMLAISATTGLRRSNLAMIRIAQHLVFVGDDFQLQFAASEMKSRRRHQVPLPSLLAPFVERYLAHYRPVLLHGGGHDALWINRYGRPVSVRNLGQRFPKITARLVGKRLTSHRVRHCLATSIVNQDPIHARNAATLLGHTSYTTSETYYVRGSMLLASRAQGSLIAARRAAIARTGDDRCL